MEQQRFQFEQELAVSDQQFKQQLDQAETMAKIEEINAKAEKTRAEAAKLLAEEVALENADPADVTVVV